MCTLQAVPHPMLCSPWFIHTTRRCTPNSAIVNAGSSQFSTVSVTGSVAGSCSSINMTDTRFTSSVALGDVAVDRAIWADSLDGWSMHCSASSQGAEGSTPDSQQDTPNSNSTGTGRPSLSDIQGCMGGTLASGASSLYSLLLLPPVALHIYDAAVNNSVPHNLTADQITAALAAVNSSLGSDSSSRVAAMQASHAGHLAVLSDGISNFSLTLEMVDETWQRVLGEFAMRESITVLRALCCACCLVCYLILQEFLTVRCRWSLHGDQPNELPASARTVLAC